MNRNRYIFYSVFGVYQLLVFIFTVAIDSDTNTLFRIVPYISWFKYGALLGLLLLGADFIWVLHTQRVHRKSQESWRHENNTLKAKVYDLQQAPPPPPASPH
jgi:ABC-type transport system involved in cytochrome bd biosynthesis fused ATPase/permease subunit